MSGILAYHRKIIFVLGVLALCAVSARADRLALWHIVHGVCSSSQAQKPCLHGDRGRDTVILKDREGIAQLLAIPYTRITGIEDPALFKPNAQNYFAQAYAQRGLMQAFFPQAPQREGLGIAVNSAYARSQDQLHLHIDCLLPHVFLALNTYVPRLKPSWQRMDVPLVGRRYWARRVESRDLAGINPFWLLDKELATPKDRGDWALAAVPLRFGNVEGFVLLADRREALGGGHAEAILDHSCGHNHG